eukprot:755127-Rhodomonas_salina.1
MLLHAHGTELAYAATGCGTELAYADGTELVYAATGCGTELAYATTYHGTELAYAATGCGTRLQQRPQRAAGTTIRSQYQKVAQYTVAVPEK